MAIEKERTDLKAAYLPKFGKFLANAPRRRSEND